MLETLHLLPAAFWVVILLIFTGSLWAITRISDGLGLPVLAVLGTVAAWYVGDVLYNDYQNNHSQKFSPLILENAWWQVAWFVTAFLMLAPWMHRLVNGRERQHTSEMFRLINSGPANPQFQRRLEQLFWGALVVWLVLATFACIKLGNRSIYYFFPYLGERADPWERGTIGGGISAVLSLVGNVQMFLAAMFGVVAALARNGTVRSLALFACFLAWPNYIFDRTRNSMLVIALPAIISWAIIRLRGGWMKKTTVLVACYMLINAWLAFVLANRSNTSIVAAARGEGISLKESTEEAHHAGLNMFEELCWINTFIKTGAFTLNLGANYYANLVNPIPRGLWANKPLIGLDYALARGQEYTDDGVTATISTGLIGQGVVNFGTLLGPAFAAWLISLWAIFLARLDLRGDQVGYFGLFQLGMVETFNMGRDITFIAIYPVIFGLALVWWMGRRNRQGADIRRSPRENMTIGQRGNPQRTVEGGRQKRQSPKRVM